MKIGDKKDKNTSHLFVNYSRGIATSRDPWCCNASQEAVSANMQSMINTYNRERERYHQTHPTEPRPHPKDVVTQDSRKISWSRSLYDQLKRGASRTYDQGSIVPSSYRPFTTQWIYFVRHFNESVSQMPKIFPNVGGKTLPNLVIATSGVGARSGFSCLMTDKLPDLNFMEAGAQCFPMYVYEKNTQDTMFEKGVDGYTKKDGISDEGLRHFQEAYPGEALTKEDIFYYVYGLLHSEEYRSRFANNLAKELPRIPCVKGVSDFWSYVEAGRALADLHLNYEKLEPYAATTKDGNLLEKTIDNPTSFYRVEKMKFARNRHKEADRSTIIYNDHITITNIPLEAYEYEVNGKPAIVWVMDRQSVCKDKDSGIVNDANRYALETMEDPSYPYTLLLRIITLSLETRKIINSLPKLETD
jgi:predicted helicase